VCVDGADRRIGSAVGLARDGITRIAADERDDRDEPEEPMRRSACTRRS